MIRRPPRSTRTDTLFPYTTLFRAPLGHDRTDAGLCIKSLNSRSARTNAFSQRPLRIKLQFQLTFHIELLKQLVFADIRADHLGDLPIIEQHPEAEAIRAAIIGNDRQALDPRIPYGRDKAFGITRKPETAGHDRSEEHTSELQSLMRISYAVFCLKKKKKKKNT